MHDQVHQQKERERKFREQDVAFGAFTLREKTEWWNEIEVGNVVDRLHWQLGMSLLDAGCSDGRVFSYCEKKGIAGSFVGMDFALNPLKQMKIAGVEALAVGGDVANVPMKSEVFDRAVSLQVIQQLPSRDERVKAFRSILRVLKPGGRFVVTVLNQASWKGLVANGKEGPLLSVPDLFVYLYDPKDLQEDLRSAGFVVLDVRGINVLSVSRLKVLKGIGVLMDKAVTLFFKGLSLQKGRYLLAVCHKK